MLRKAHVKECSNDGQYHVVKNYDVCMSAFVSSVRTAMYTRKTHGTRRYHGITRNFQNVRKCANSGYQALFSDFSNRPGYEATLPAA